jgi:superoxide dismutase, Cu-Zn family
MSDNPFSRSHGGPTDKDRHVGDLGNFQTDSQGDSTGILEDRLVKLIGPESVIGVSLLAHADQVI